MMGAPEVVGLLLSGSVVTLLGVFLVSVWRENAKDMRHSEFSDWHSHAYHRDNDIHNKALYEHVFKLDDRLTKLEKLAAITEVSLP